jgi:hypothetical protein
MRKITGLDDKMLTITEGEDDSKMPTRRGLLQLMGNQKAETADDARRVRRILTKIRDKSVNELVLENDDINFLQKFFENNPVGLPSWMQGQILDIISDAEKVETLKVV